VIQGISLLELKSRILARCWWLTLVILATPEAEMGRISVHSQPWANTFLRPYLKNTQHKKGLVEWLKW
jgi:hypothetical protein